MGARSAISTIKRAGTLVRITLAAQRVRRATPATRQAARHALIQLLADARGVPLKVGQLLANVSPDPAMADLARGVKPQPWRTMSAALEASLGQPVKSVFRDIHKTGLAASLGQVHQATLRDGTRVAVKIRYPDIMQAVDAEMRLAGLMPGVGPVHKWGFDLSGYKAMLKANMERELDYRGEMQRQDRFASRLRVPGLVVPRVLPQWCSDSVLVQSWEEGEHLDRVADWPVEQRQQVAGILLQTFFASLFEHGEIHADPHLGNVLARRGPEGVRVALLDFGCTLAVSEPARLAMLKLIQGARQGDATDPLACFAAMGFDAAKLEPLADRLPAMARLLLEPFLGDGTFFVRDWDLSRRMSDLLGDLRWWFRSAGPCDLLLFVRAFCGLVQQLALLKVGQSWWPLLQQSVSAALLEQARAFSPPPPPVRFRSARDFSSLARFLCVHISEEDHMVVSVSLPAAQVMALRQIMPAEVLERVKAARIDLDQIVHNACARGLVPQPLFEFNSDKRRHRVWLE